MTPWDETGLNIYLVVCMQEYIVLTYITVVLYNGLFKFAFISNKCFSLELSIHSKNPYKIYYGFQILSSKFSNFGVLLVFHEVVWTVLQSMASPQSWSLVSTTLSIPSSENWTVNLKPDQPAIKVPTLFQPSKLKHNIKNLCVSPWMIHNMLFPCPRLSLWCILLNS